MKWLKENKTYSISFYKNQKIEVYSSEGNYLRTMNAKDLNLYWEKKENKKTNRGLRIKIPGAKTFVRCQRIQHNDNGEGYSFEDIIERIEKNGRLRCDPKIKEFIDRQSSQGEKYEEKNRFFDDVDIKQKWKHTNYYNNSKKKLIR